MLPTLVLAAGLAASPSPGAAVVAPSKTAIGYATVADALSDLRTKPGNDLRVEQGWTIIYNSGTFTLWSFVPTDHPAYPAVVRRIMSKRDGAVYVDLSALCQAQKAPCDKLVAEFRELNAKMAEHMKIKSRAK